MSLEWERAPRWPEGAQYAHGRSHSRRRGGRHPKSNVFPRLSYGGLTPLMAFSINAKIDAARAQISVCYESSASWRTGGSTGSRLRSLIENRDQLLRYILFLLASGDEEAASSGDLRRLLKSAGGGPDRGAQIHICWKRCFAPFIAVPHNLSA